MNWSYVHATTNHLPVILVVVGALAALAALVTRRRAVWLYAVATLTLAGLVAYPTQLTGSAAAQSVSRFPGVERSVVAAHEEAGETTTWVLLGTGLVSAIAWWQLVRRGRDQHGNPAVWLRVLVTVGALASLGMTARTAQLGGIITHGKQTLRGVPALPTGVPVPAPLDSARPVGGVPTGGQ